jgi:T5SS/PEP-CTERM-associated repeat protein
MPRRAWLLAFTAMTVIGVPTASTAQSVWTAGSNSTDWFTSGNWSPNGVPTAGTNVVVDTTSPFPTVISGAPAVSNLSTIGTAAGSTGNVTVTGAGSTWTNSSALDLGVDGSGTLNVLNGGHVSNTVGNFGLNAGSTGTATVSGIGSSWTNSNLLTIGFSGNGALNVAAGGLVSNTVGLIAATVSSTSTATVTGANSTWTNSGGLVVGQSGNGTLNVLNGGTVTDTDGTLGANVGATGIALVNGTNSRWTNSGLLLVGSNGTGTLTVQSGGAASGNVITIGSNATGDVTVDGVGSTLTSNQHINIGLSSSGTLTVQNGGAVSNTFAVVGSSVGANGTATVTGANSIWTNSSTLDVGQFASGRLNVLNGGKVSDTNGTLGSNAGVTGIATVSGANSSWTNSGLLLIGRNGTGTLNIQNGGAASGNVVTIGFTGTGDVTVDGTGSTLTSTQHINLGNGTLTVQNGGSVSNTFASLGAFGAPATATVTGANSTWTNSAYIRVGEAATATLNILNGGRVSNATADIGMGASGTVTVNGAGSTWTNAGVLSVGVNSTGILNIQGGGVVSSTGTALIGTNGGTIGIVNVTGAGSTWTNSNHVNVGAFGTGTLTIADGGTVSGTAVVIAAGPGSTGTLNIGAASAAPAAAPGAVNAPIVTFGDGTGQIVFNHTAAKYTFAPLISGVGTVLVESGTTSLTAINTYTGNTTVTGGTLAVNGSIASSPLTTVSGSGTLGGNGTVGNTTFTGGTLAPGNSVGTLTAQGNLILNAATTYMVEVGSGGADRTNVTGNATLGGATVQAIYANDAFVTHRYTIVNAGVRIGTFGTLVNTNLPANFSTTLNYDTNNAYLDVTLNFVPAPGAGSGLNINQANVANALTSSFNATGGIPLALGGLTRLGLTLASGEAATGTQQTTFDAMDRFLNIMTDPFTSSRAGGMPQAGAMGYDEAEATSYASVNNRKTQDAHAAIVAKALPRTSEFSQRWNVWSAGYGGSQSTGGNAVVGSNDYAARIYGGAAGVDYRLSPDTLVGFALGGAGTSYHLANGLGGGRSDMFQAGIYARHNVGSAYIAAALAYGWQDITTDRTVLSNQLRANFDANAAAGRLETGYRFATGLGGLTPYAAGQFTTFFVPAYAERTVAGIDNFALSYFAKDVTTSRSELGLRTDTSFAAQDAVITLRGRAAWAHDFNTERSATSFFQALPASTFVVYGTAPAGDAALVSASVEKKWLNGLSVAASFEGQFSHVTESYAGKGMVRYAW